MPRLKGGSSRGLLLLGGVCTVTIFNAVRAFPTDPQQGVGELVTVGISLFLVCFIAYVVWSTRAGSVRDRRETIQKSLGPTYRWVADVNVVLSSCGRREPEVEVKVENYSVFLGDETVGMWRTASDQSPAFRIERDRILQMLPDPSGPSGGFVIKLREPESEIKGTVVGAFWGGLDASERDVERVAQKIEGISGASHQSDEVA